MPKSNERTAEKVKALQKKFERPEPLDMRVDGGDAIAEVSALIDDYVVTAPGVSVAVSLWVTMTYLFESFRFAPKLAILSPEMRCGKSTLLEILEAVCCKPLRVDNASTAALFRVVDQYHPTLLLDEVDTYLHEQEELRGVLNASSHFDGSVLRCVNEAGDVGLFNVYAPVAMAGIGRLAATLLDRSIPVMMRRRLTTEKVARWSMHMRRSDRIVEIRRRLETWTMDCAPDIVAADPTMPEALSDRGRDIWRPLFQIAKVAGAGWLNAVERWSVELSELSVEEDLPIGTRLLRDIRERWPKACDELSPSQLVDVLVEIADAPWRDWRAGKPITARTVGRMLGGYKISTSVIKRDGRTYRMFRRTDFVEAWRRYVDPSAGDLSR